MIIYDTFFRRSGVRLPQHLLAPNLPSLEGFSFPKSSIHHFTTMDNIVTGPSTHEHLYRDIEKKIFVHHILESTASKGEPRKVAIPLEPLVREFHIRHKRYRRAIKLENIPRDENTLVVINYALLTKSTRYMKSLYADYNRWWNLHKTVWDAAGKVAKVSDRHQFIFLELPKVLPSVARLNNFIDKVNPNFIGYFRDHNALMLLEFWKWFDPETRKDSILAGLDDSDMSKINVIYQESGRMLVLNLGLLNSWILKKVEKPTDPDAAIQPNGKLVPDKIRKCFLRMLMTLMEYRTVDASVDPDMGNDTEKVTDETDATDSEPTTTEIDQSDTFIVKNDDITVHTATSADQQVQEPHTDTFEERFKDLEKDLDQLQVIEKEQDIEQSLEKSEVENQAIANSLSGAAINLKDFDTAKTPEQVLKDTCDALTDDGLMSGAEYRKYIAQIDKIGSLPAPDGKGTISDYIKINQDDIIIKEPKKFKDKYNVVDKSMLESSLDVFDKNYITKVLPKDIASMPMSLQRAGFVVSKYDIETHEDILGSSETHVIRINPIVGKSSTIRIKIPTIQPNGTFKVGGVDYRARKQRGDVPIRKISPNRVALTSYYGKTFVNRSEKRVADYGTWLQNKINNAVIDGNTNIVTAYPANVFNHEAITPRAYSSISMVYRRIDVSGFELYFDLVERTKQFTAEQIKKFELKGSIILGKHRDGRIAILDNNNMVNIAFPSGDPEPISSIEEFLGFENKVPPVEMAEARVFGMNIPVGLVLGYLYGLDKLLTLLKVTPRRVNTGTRVNLQDYEYALAFSDETLVFNRDDELVKLVMGGFLDYEKAIKSYSVYQFDKRAVYLNVLESKKITTRYLREIDLIDKLFVDPITESILKEMNEPTTYRGLVMRSCELLLNDAHPRSLDLNFQRIKGYERVAGAVYSELVNSIRDHRGKLGRSSASIDLKPFAVWKRVVGDPAVKITEDINPINTLKEVEAVTFSGVGGRNSRSLTRESREYDPNDLGVISESTVDSSDVAINVYTTANPNFSSVRGLTNRVSPKEIKSTQLLSTSALLGAGSDTDDQQN